MRKDMLQLFRMYQQNFLIILAAGIAVLILAFLLLHWKFREPLKRYFAKYRKLLSQKAVPQILLVFLLYVAQNLISTAMYAIPAVLLCDVPAEQLGLFLGTYLFSWIIGFITPGAPGGIGIREAVMTLMCGSFLGTETIVLYAVIMRIISTFGDVLAFLIGLLLEWRFQHTQKATS